MLDQAFEALKTFDWGTDRTVLNPIDEAVVTTREDAAARQALETRLVALLPTEVSRDAKDFVCRTLMVIGTAAAVPALAALLPEGDLSHMARYALERLSAPEAAQALRDALPQLDGPLKVGAIGSLGVRRDQASVPALVALLNDPDTAVACAAAFALGSIRSAEGMTGLAAAKPASGEARMAITDASLACAEGLLAEGKKAEALAVYKQFVRDDQPKHVRLAATRGMLACAGKTD